MKKKSPVLAILLVLTLAMTVFTGWYFLIDQNISEIISSASFAGKDKSEDLAGEPETVDQSALETTIQEAEPEKEVEKSDEAKAAKEAKMQAAKEKVESEFDTVSQTSKNPSNVAKLGSKEKQPSGEVTGTLADGTQARNAWAEDENGKLFYFGYDGCLVKNNYAPDGFFAGADGALDASVSRIIGSQGKMLIDKEFVTDTSSDPLILVQKDPDNVYECLFIKRYSFGYDEVYGVISDPDSDHAYLLNTDPDTKVDFKSTKGALLTILDDGKTMIVSDCGVTETYHTK